MADGLTEVLGGLAAALLALGLAVLLARIAGAAFAIAAPHDAEAVPVLRLLAIWSGAAFGLALIVAAPHGAIFAPGRVLSADGAWGVGLPALLGQHGLPRAEAFAALPDELMGSSLAGSILVWLALLGFGQGVFTALRLWHGPARRRALAAFVMLSLHITLLTHYAVHLLGWFAAQLGPWLFALALLVFQRWRYGMRRAH